MARNTGADCRQCRREKCKLFLKGDRCYSDKCALVRRAKVPGVHADSRKKATEYGLQLREKQKTNIIFLRIPSMPFRDVRRNRNYSPTQLIAKAISFFRREATLNLIDMFCKRHRPLPNNQISKTLHHQVSLP